MKEMEKAVKLNEVCYFDSGASDDIYLEQKDDMLIVIFNDFLSHYEYVFESVVAFKWQPIFDLLSGEIPEGYYIIEKSLWLKEHLIRNVISADECHMHYRFNMAMFGQLEVLATNYHDGDRARELRLAGSQTSE